VRRNRVQVTAAALVLLALVLGVVGTTLGLIEARRQEGHGGKRLAQVTKMNDILGSIFKDLNPANAQKDSKPLTAVLGERLERATAEIEGESTGDPLAVARMQMTLGAPQLGLGYPDRAIVLFTKARATFATALGPDHRDTLQSMNYLALTYFYAGQNERALKLREETLMPWKTKLEPDHPDTLGSMSALAESYGAAGQNERALKLYDETLALMRAKLGPNHPYTLAWLDGQARCLANSGQHDRAGETFYEVIESRRKTQGNGHPDTFQSRMRLLGQRPRYQEGPPRGNTV
jgi:non-specific serine/threonine protein kinase/serine/threonine-protein kinase